MERIVRLNAIENLCQSGILGMKQHSLHPVKHLTSQKLTISGVSFVSTIKAFLNTLNQKCNTLFMLRAAIGNTGFLSVFLQKLVNKPYQGLFHLVLWSTITFVMIFAGGGTRQIARVTRGIRKAELWVVKTRNLRLPEVVRREQVKAKDTQAFYNKYAVWQSNLSYPQINIFNQEDKVQIKLTLLGDLDCGFMRGWESLFYIGRYACFRNNY